MCDECVVSPRFNQCGDLRTVSDLVTELDILLSVDDDLLLAIDGNDLGGAVRIARVVDQPPLEEKKRHFSSARWHDTTTRTRGSPS